MSEREVSNAGASLTLERRAQADETPTFAAGGTMVMMTPVPDEDYWAYRVMLSETQAIVGFPKFGTIGIGFAVEGEDGWNLNLPYRLPTAEAIFAHIARNKGDATISDAGCIEAIRMVQAAAREDRGDPPRGEEADA